MKGLRAALLAACFGMSSLSVAAEPATSPATSLVAASSAAATPEQKKQAVEHAVQTFYRALHERDMATIAGYIPAEGFTEFSSKGGQLKQQTLETVRALLSSGAQVDVRLENLRIDLLSPDVAMVTGLRVGVVAYGGAPAVPLTKRMTSLWVQHAGQWRLTHVHYSALD